MPAEEEKRNPTNSGATGGTSIWNRWFQSMFHNDNSNMAQEIHDKLNQHEERLKQMRRSGFPFTLHQELEQLLHQQQQRQEQMESNMMKNNTRNRQSRMMYSSSYRMRQDLSQVQIDVDVPEGMDAKDLQVQVLQEFPCVIQWSGGTNSSNGTSSSGDATTNHLPFRRTAGFHERVRLGQSVDCAKLSANLSEGILKIQAPMFARIDNDPKTSRSVPVTEHDMP